MTVATGADTRRVSLQSARTTHLTVEEVLERGLIEAALQPIVSLRSTAVVAHEALARGPEGSALHRPDQLFAAAAAEGLTAELDRACMSAAFVAAAQAPAVGTLFVNAEPQTFTGPPPDAPSHVHVVVEVTERGLTERPAELLEALERSRLAGWGVAADDIGADWRSLALLPILRPCVIKLDRAVLANGPTRETARVLRAARAQVDRLGGRLLAEGIEEHEHAQRAVGFGSELGQGWLYGRPQRADASAPATESIGLQQPTSIYERTTPFDLLVRSGVPRAVGTKAELLPLSVDIELDAVEQRDPRLLLSTFQTAERFTPNTRQRYAALAQEAAYVAVFGTDMPPHPVPNVTGSCLADREALTAEWVVLAVGPHMASGLIARDLGDEGVPDAERRFEYALISDRTLIERAARSLMLRLSSGTSAQP